LDFRRLLLQPGFTLLAAFSLALGIGVVATQFSLIDGIILRGLPIPDAQRLVHVARESPQSNQGVDWETVPYRDYLFLREAQTSLETLAAVNPIGLNLTGDGRVPSHYEGAKVSANLLEVLGVAPQLGRWFDPEEDRPGQPLFVVVSHGFWQEEFGADPRVLGRSVTLNGEVGTIIGVMPSRFTFPTGQKLWINLRAAPDPPHVRLADRLEMVGKVRPSVSIQQAKAEFNTLARRLIQMFPDTNQGYKRMNVEKFAYAYAGGGTEPVLYLMLAMTVFILALSCVNVANMLLARACRRGRELAVRAAVGATRWRLVRQLLVESLVLAFVGAFGGLVLAGVGVDQLQHQFVERMNVLSWLEFRLDHRVLGITILVTWAAGLLAGIVPALQAARVDVHSALKDGSRHSSSLSMNRFSSWLVTLQIGFSSMLLISACLLGWTTYQIRKANLRYEPDRLLVGRIELHEGTHPTKEDRARFYQELLRRLQTEPAVESVVVSSRNMISPGVQTRVGIEGVIHAHENDQPYAWLEVISRDYFELFGVGLVSGRLFDSRDHYDAPRSALVNESFARKHWPEDTAVGQRFRSGQTGDHWVTVVGVVPDLQMDGLFSPSTRNAAGFYLFQDQMGWGWLNLVVKTRADSKALVEPLRRAVAEVDPDQPLFSIGTLAEHTAREIHGFTIVGSMAGFFALTTLFLGAIGVYGVTSFSVGQRTREFGVRMALGASVGSVLRLVMSQGLRQIGYGLGGGLIAALFLTRPMRGVVNDELITNPWVYVGVTCVIASVALLALWIPARRAAKISPMEALRSE